VKISRHPRPAGLYRHRDEKRAPASSFFSSVYKCPLPQLLSFDILTNAPGVWGPVVVLSSVVAGHSSVSPLFATHTDFAPVSPVFATHTKTTGVYTNNSHSGTRHSSPRSSAHSAPLRYPFPLSAFQLSTVDCQPPCGSPACHGPTRITNHQSPILSAGNAACR
jgi:hypothetical protein